MLAIRVIGTLAILLSISQLVRADDLLPIALEAELFAKVLTYDRNFASRAGENARILLVVKVGNADSSRVALQMQSALKSAARIWELPHDEIVVPFRDAATLADLCKSTRAAAVFFGPGFDDDIEAIRAALDGHHVLTAGSVPEYVPHGIVVGFDVVSGSPKVLVHLTQAKRQHVDFRAQLLHVARVFE